MKFAIALFLYATAAQATVIDVSPKIPIDCQQREERAVSYVRATSSDAPDSVTLNAALTYGTCQAGLAKLQNVNTIYNVYVVDQEYSRSFQSSYALANPLTVSVSMNLKPSNFFSVYNARHIQLVYYPSSGSLSFVWNVTITRDPVTNAVFFQILPH
jgi:hypothetical protein